MFYSSTGLMKTRLSSLGELNFEFLTLYALVNALTEPFLTYDSFRVFDQRAFTTTLTMVKERCKILMKV